MKRLHYTIEIKQVENGYLLDVTERNKYDQHQTVHVTLEDALNALRKSFVTVKDSALQIAAVDAITVDAEKVF